MSAYMVMYTHRPLLFTNIYNTNSRKSVMNLELRIENSWYGVICVVVIFSVPMHVIFTYYTAIH